jgi:hypothetical protein
MVRFIIVSLIGGLLFGTLDGVIHGNPFAAKLLRVYQPIMKTRINPVAGIIIDLIYGFLIAAIFLLLYRSLPGESGLIKGIVFGCIIWFFRVAMSVASSWMMYNVPGETLLYTLITGLGEMLILGILYGLTLKPLL